MEKQKLPNGTLIVILGALSLVTWCCYGIPGLILGIITLVLANNSKKTYLADPELYDNYSQVKTGKILGIIGLILSVLAIIFFIGIIAWIGWDAIGDPQIMQERMEEIQRESGGY